MPSDLEWMELHVEAEFTHDAHGRLLRVNEPAGGPAPRFFLGHTKAGVVRRYRHDVSHALRRELEAASARQRLGDAAADVPLDPAPYESILAREAPIRRTSTGLAFRFPAGLSPAPGTRLLLDANDASLLHPLLPEWVPDVRKSQPLVARIVEGRAVAVCGSVRITPRAHEAGVETAAAHRGRGHAVAVLTTWATAVRERGAEPLYSTLWENGASRAVARKLGLVAVGRDLHIT